MTFDEILDQVRELLSRRGRVTYRSLKLRYQLDDELLAGVTDELIKAERIAADENGEVLVWVGNTETEKDKGERIREKGRNGESEGKTAKRENGETGQDYEHRTSKSELSDGERRQLTVMFCDLVGSTALSAQLDPEELREVVQAYQETCTAVIRRYDGYVAQHLGDGLLVYFGYPRAHENDARHAVRAGLEIVKALQQQVPSPLRGESLSSPSSFQGEGWGKDGAVMEDRVLIVEERRQRSSSPIPQSTIRNPQSLRVRIGIHTGLVVIGEIGSSEKREILAMGETPNIAARIQGTANADEVVISAATYRLVEGLFACEDRGQPDLKGVATPLSLYRVIKESDIHSRFEVVARRGLTPLIGREHEFGLLRERWQRVKDGAGQVVLLSGEPGIGKSRLVEALKETVEHDGAQCLELRCSPYAQNSALARALAPVIEHLQRMLQFQPEDTPEKKFQKLEAMLKRRDRAETRPYPTSQDTILLLSTLLSLPHPQGYPPLTLSPQKQKEKTHEALVSWLCAEAQQHAVTYAWEDLHWADPSTLELLTLFLAQVPATRLLVVLTFRPEFIPSWSTHSYLSRLTLGRLGHSQVEAMVEKVTGGKALPREVVRQIAAKTDGVPLFVEELTKMVVESNLVKEVDGHYELSGPLPSLAIPSTLQDSLMARLDRLSTVREIAQVGATLGREFNFELLRAVSLLPEDTLQQGLKQLVEAELMFQSGIPPQARYLFKHALVQDTAYQSLLKSRRQQLHQQAAQVLVERFPQTVEAQPELVAHHYTEAGLIEQAITYWQKAGEQAIQRSANEEAISHLTKGLDLLKLFPDTPARSQKELRLQLTLGPAVIALKGWAAPEVEKTYTRAQEICQHLGENSQLFSVLFGLQACYVHQAKFQTARELAEQGFVLAQKLQDPAIILEGHHMLVYNLLNLGELTLARKYSEGITFYDSPSHPLGSYCVGDDPVVCCLSHRACALWTLGYPDQALKSAHDALIQAQKLSHPLSLALALIYIALVYQFRRERQTNQEWVEAAMTLSTEQGFEYWVAWGTILKGWALTEQRQREGINQIRQGLAAYQATGSLSWQQYHLALLAEAYSNVDEAEEGLSTLTEAQAWVEQTEGRFWEAELYRLKGQLTLQKSRRAGNARPTEESEAEAYFLKAIDIARKQQAKSLELRAMMSLVRLRQYQALEHGEKNETAGKRERQKAGTPEEPSNLPAFQPPSLRLAEAHKLLSEVYNWFTEGFDTLDLQEAKALLEELKVRS